MLESVAYLYDKFSLIHLNISLLLGLALFGGTIGGRIFQKHLKSIDSGLR